MCPIIADFAGGGSGIGRAVCSLFAREGAHIAAVDQNQTGVEETIKILGGVFLNMYLSSYFCHHTGKCFGDILNVGGF